MSDMEFDLPSDSDEDVPDWLKDLGGDEPPQDAGAAEEETLDWMADANDSAPEPGDTPALQSEADPDLLPADKPEDESVSAVPPSEAEEVPDWLSADESEAAPVSVPASAGEEEIQDEVPDWLSNIRASEAENDSQPEISAAEDESSESEGDPEWLDRIREHEDERLATDNQGEQEEAVFIDDIQLEEGDEQSAGDGIEEPQSPDWLSGLQSDQDAPEADEEQSLDEKSGMDQEESPSKVEGVTSILKPKAEKTLPETDDPIPDETLAELREDRDKAVEGIDSEFPDLPKDSSFKDTGSLPSWLVDMKRTGSLEESELPTNDADTFTREEFLSSPSEDEDSPELDLSLGELPDWISESDSAVDQTDEVVITPQGKVEDDVTPAEVPNWLNSMRPVESPYAEEEGAEGVEETIGPLAGLQNVLPAEPEITLFEKPSAFSLNLETTESQQYNASLLDRMIDSDINPKKSGTAAMALTQGVLRWVIAGLIFFSLLIPILTGSQSIPLPPIENIPPETLRLQNLVSNLEQGTSILVAFDYQPGVSAEMHAAAAAVFDHLLLQGAQLVLVSTEPTGPALAENFLLKTQAARHRQVSEKKYCNMGYISGGTAALLNLTGNPQQSLPTAVCDGQVVQNPWDFPPLQNITGISDFAMLIVLTDDAGTARAWIEQVQPALGDTPLMMIISAQIEPLIRPYYQSEPKQVSAFVTGILGGAYYESSIGRDHIRTARLYWNSYSVGLGVSVSIILIGSIGSLGSFLLARRKGPKSEAQI